LPLGIRQIKRRCGQIRRPHAAGHNQLRQS
jgi:hypothetical protein